MWFAHVAGSQWFVDESLTFYYSRDAAMWRGQNILTQLVIALLPLFVARAACGWQLQAPRNVTATVTPRHIQFSLGELMLATAYVALAIGLGQILLPTNSTRFPYPSFFATLWGTTGFWLAIEWLANTAVVLPCVWGAFSAARRWPIRIVGWLLYAGIVSILETATLYFFIGMPADRTGSNFIFYPAANISQGACVFSALALLRATGLQFVSGVKQPLSSLQTDR